MTQLSPRWTARLKLLGAGALVGLGLDAASPSSRPLMLIAALLVLGGSGWFLHTLFAYRKDGILYRRRKEIWLALGTAAVTLLLIVAISISVRLAPRLFTVENQTYDAELGWAPPNVADRFGQRGQVLDRTRPQIVAIGDSILYGHGVGDQETATHYLDQILEGHQVLNLAVSGYSIDQYYIYLKRVLPQVNAKLVIVGVFTGNDYEVTGLEYGWGHTKPLYRLNGDSLILHNTDLLADNCIDHMAQSLLFRILWMRKDFALTLIHLFCNPVKLGIEELEQVISKLFAGIEQEAASRGARVLFVLLPVTQRLQALEDGTASYSYLRLREILEAGGHELFEFYPDIYRAAGENEDGIFLDGAHFRPRGHELLAQSLARVIRERGLLD